MGKILIKSALFCSSLFFISGCGVSKVVVTEPSALVKTKDSSQEAESKEVTKEQMKLFFSRFLNIDSETMQILNQKPKVIDDEYWRIYKAYQIKIDKILGGYLSTEAKMKLKKQYLHDDFHFPRLIEINDYMITSISQVSDVIISSKQTVAGSNIYEVDVIALAEVIDLDWAKGQYRWDDKKGYYIEADFDEPGMGPEVGPRLDRIRVSMTYLVEVPSTGGFTVASVREKSGFHLGMDEKGHMKNNEFITRLSFLKGVIVKEEAVIHKFINAFLKQDYNFYHYYRKAYETGYETFRTVLESDLALSDFVVLEPISYKHEFEPSIIPLKDNMESLVFDLKEDVQITPHISSSAKRSTYQVNIKVDMTLINGKVVPYEYIYLVILNKELKITSVRLMTQGEVDLDLAQ